MSIPYPVRLCLVDDEPEHTAKIQAWCDSHWIQFEHKFTSLKEFETYMSAQDDKVAALPEIIVLDHNLERAPDPLEGKREGIELLSALRRYRAPRTVVVYVSQSMGRSLAQKARDEGAHIVVHKQAWTEELEPFLEEAYQRVIVRAAFDRYQDITSQLRIRYPEPDNLFLMTPFPDRSSDKILEAVLSGIESKLCELDCRAIRLDRAQPGQDLTYVDTWVKAHLTFCSRAVALFYRRECDGPELNANVAYELGYVTSFRKPVLLVNLAKNQIRIPANLTGVLTVEIDAGQPEEVARRVAKWVSDSRKRNPRSRD